MNAIEFKEHNVVFAKDQKEYNPLPAHAQQNGIVTFCMKLNSDEVKQIVANKKVNLTVLNFNRPVQPVALSIKKPEFPIPIDVKLNANPSEWDKEKGLATFSFAVLPLDLHTIKKEKKLWITTVTYGTPLQPISQILKS